MITDIFGNEVPLVTPGPTDGTPRPPAYQLHLIDPQTIDRPVRTAGGATVRVAQGAFDLEGAPTP